MENNITIFNSEEFGEIKVLEQDNQAWFIGKEIALILGYAKPSVAVSKKVSKEDRRAMRMETPGGMQNMTIINEKGLYSLILSSKRPNTNEFHEYIVKVVTPGIKRKALGTMQTNALIEVQENEQGEATVKGRELHERLGISTRYNDWFKRMLGYGFEESIDYIGITQKRVTAQGNEVEYTEHIITLDMAKEIAMLQRSEEGQKMRRYFIDLEKKWNDPDVVVDRAMKILQNKVMILNGVIEEQKPKIAYYENVMMNDDLYSVTAIAKDYGMGAAKFNRILEDLGVQYKQGGRWYLTSKYDSKGYAQSNYLNVGKIIDVMQWTERGRAFLYELLEQEGIYITTVKNKMEENEKVN